MRFPVLRTLSARIIVGFAVLILTFGAVSVLTVSAMSRLGRDIRIIQTGYFELALISKDLSEKQNDLRQYLIDELSEERTTRRVGHRVRRYRKARERLLEDADHILSRLSDLPRGHAQRVKSIKVKVAGFRRDVAALDPFYDHMLKAPPLDQTAIDIQPPNKEEAERAAMAFAQIKRRERVLYGRLHGFARDQKRLAKGTAERLERNARRLQLYTVYLGVTAAIIGLLMTIWATLTLRPLKRLSDGARRIARGDYASRIEERGPSEVAELAKEFNVMGRAVEERERELVRSERLVAVGKMAAMITHEVRNPLSSIGLNTELLEEELAAFEGEEAAEARSLCRTINTEVDRLTGITEEYLQFARLPKPKLQPEALDRIIENLAEFEREQLTSRGVGLELDLTGELPPVLVDDAQIRQSLLNLLRNAADAVEEVGGGVVTIGAHLGDDGQSVLVRVENQGRGIPEDMVPKLFDPFFSTKEGGTGLGLALTHQIIQEHGGRIRVESTPGNGSTFLVSLPVAGGSRIGGSP